MSELHNDAERICTALEGAAGVASVTRGWPRDFARLPCLAVCEAANRPVEFRDDDEYLTELEYYVRVFAKQITETDALAGEVNRILRELGYQRTFSYEDDDGTMRQRVFRYRRTV